MARPLWFVELVKKAFPGRFGLARATRLPLIGRAVDALLFAGDDIIYLPKDSVIPVNRPVDSGESMVLPSQVVAHFIDRADHLWVMDCCICRDASGCQDHPIDLGCLFLGEAVHGINPQLGRLVTRAEAHAHVQQAREAGLVHMVGRNKLDTMWLGIGPGDKLMTICNCCPCCCLWRILPLVDQSIGGKVTRMPGVSVVVSDLCAGCKLCVRDVCFAGAISMNGKQAVISDACRGCGRCVEVCPLDAIELQIADPDFVDHAIGRLSAVVKVSGS